MEVWLTIVVCFCILYYFLPQKYLKWLLLAFVLAMSIMSFHCVPKPQDDLARYFKILDIFKDTDWEGLQWHIEHKTDEAWNGLPVCAYYFWFISKLGNTGFLPAITMFICYGAMFLMIYKCSVRYNVGKWYTFWGCLFAISTFWFFDACSGIRNGLGFCTFLLCIYYDMVEKKYRPLCYFGYVFCVGLHSSLILMVFVRVCMAIIQKFESKIIYYSTLCSMSIGASILTWLGENSDNAYLQKIGSKADSMTQAEFALGTQYIVNSLVLIVVTVCTIFLFNYVVNSKKSHGFETFIKFHKFFLFFTWASYFIGLIFLRITRWLIPILGGIFYMIGMQCFRDHIESEETKVKTKTIIRKEYTNLTTIEFIINLVFIGFTLVHLWYACNGTSLLWLYFEPFENIKTSFWDSI